MRACPACGGLSSRVVLDAGLQPVCSRFLPAPNAPEYVHPMTLERCACGLFRLKDPVPPKELRPPYDWIAAIEPEGHLDRLADMLADLTLERNAPILGVSFKDASFLRRMKDRGFSRAASIDPAADLGIRDPNAGIETLQAALTLRAAEDIARAKGRPKLIVLRHVLEHAQDLSAFLGALKALLDPEGYLVVELPDCRRLLESLDYSMLWEDHAFYFTRESFESCLAGNGFAIERLERFPYPLEDSLVAVARPGKAPGAGRPSSADSGLAEAYAAGFAAERSTWRERLEASRRAGGKVAVFGAGHSGAVFVNLMGLGGLIEFFVDDHPRKQGLFMPGSHLPIRPSKALLEEGIRLCLLALSPESEEKILAKNAAFRTAGGAFQSIFPSSRRSLGAQPC